MPESAYETTLKQLAALLQLRHGGQAHGVPTHVLARDVLGEMLRMQAVDEPARPEAIAQPILHPHGYGSAKKAQAAA